MERTHHTDKFIDDSFKGQTNDTVWYHQVALLGVTYQNSFVTTDSAGGSFSMAALLMLYSIKVLYI